MNSSERSRAAESAVDRRRGTTRAADGLPVGARPALPTPAIAGTGADDDSDWAEQFPQLFAPAYVDYADADIQMTTTPVPEDLINRLHVVAITEAGRVVVCASDMGWRFLPGGTREPGETVEELIAREMLEEAGAEPTGPAHIFSAHAAHCHLTEPHRPHLAHPRAYWAYAVAPVRLVGPPTCPDDGEQITDVQCLEPAEAAAYLAVHDDAHADVLRLADAMGLIPAPGTTSHHTGTPDPLQRTHTTPATTPAHLTRSSEHTPPQPPHRHT